MRLRTYAGVTHTGMMIVRNVCLIPKLPQAAWNRPIYGTRAKAFRRVSMGRKMPVWQRPLWVMWIPLTSAGSSREREELSAGSIARVERSVNKNIIVTQVVPPLDSSLQIVKDAKKSLGSKLNYVSLEGYVVGRFLLEALKKIPGKEITRDSLLSTINGRKFNIGGLVLDYSNDNQGSDLVIATYLENDRFNIVGNGDMKELFR